MKCNSLYCRILALCSLLALVAGTTGVLFSAGPPQLLVLTLNSSLSPSAARLLAGTSSSLTATLVTGEHSKDVTRLVRDWSSSNPAVATVDSQGHVTAGSVGTTTITATLGGAVSASLALAVTSASPPVFQVQPSATGVSAVITPGVVVSVQDNLGDPLAGLAVTMSIGTNPSGKGILTGTVAQTTNSAGTATFSDVRIDWLGSGHTLVATVTTPTTPVFSISNPFDETRVGDPCLGPNSLGNANPVCTLAGLAACPSRTSDGLNDAWKIAGGIDLNGDGVIDAQHDLLLPGADLNKPDIYLQYDWMGYGPMETPCNNNLDCTSPYLGLKGATCSGPALTQGFAASCVLACSTDFDCTSKGLSHLTDRCGMANGIQQCLHTHDPALLAPDGSGGSEALGAVAAKFAEHVPPQSMPVGEDVTVPLPVPSLVTARLKLPVGVAVAALEAVLSP